MVRTALVGTGVGVVASGMVVGLLVPMAPSDWHTPATIWATTVAVIVLCVIAAARLTRPE